MTSSAIIPNAIEPIADLAIDEGLAAALLNSVAEYGAQLHGRRVWLACSGGRDSLALAALCVQLYRQGKLPFLPQLLHVDHCLQADSQHWAVHVANWARAQQIPCSILPAHVTGHDEQAARQARYDVMRAHINQEDVLLLAHHADDQAETVLMRLMQGAGVNGLSGMQPWRIQTQGAQRMALWRPWLTIRRSSISAYAKRLKLPYIDDPTNDTGDNVRSGLRRDIMPVLAKYNPNVIENMARSAQLLGDAELIVRAQAVEDLQQTTIGSLQLPPAQRVLNIDALASLPIYRQRQLLHYWLGQDEPLPPAKQLVDEVLRLSQRRDHDHQTELFWQGRKQSYTIRRYRQQLYRLSSEWLAWLKMPLDAQTQTLSDLAASDPTVSPPAVAAHSADSHSVSISLRTSKHFTWQVQMQAHVLAEMLKTDTDNVEIKIVPLDRQQRVQIAGSSRPQSGKKLYQTLGMPIWLREILIVLSVVFHSDDNAKIELPILLLSPFDSWILSGVLDSDDYVSHGKNDAFAKGIHNHLSIDNC